MFLPVSDLSSLISSKSTLIVVIENYHFSCGLIGLHGSRIMNSLEKENSQ